MSAYTAFQFKSSGLVIYRIADFTAIRANISKFSNKLQWNLSTIIQKKADIRLRVADISVIGRNTQGVKLIGLGEGEKVVGVARLMEED